MARPRAHGDDARAALLDAAERIIIEAGPHALSIRSVAEGAKVSTRAVYSLFGSKGGLVAELARRAFGFLRDELDARPVTEDPARDLEDCGAISYRRFVLEHPSLYRIAFQRVVPELEMTEELLADREEAFGRLELRLQRIADRGLLRDRSVRAAAVEFNAMCEGLANAELRGGTMHATPAGEDVWREAFQTVITGLTAP